MEESNIIPFDQSEKSKGISKSPMKSTLVDQASKIVKDPQVLINIVSQRVRLNIVSQRVRQLNSGRAPLIDALPSMGAADIALTEIIEGKIVVSASEGV